MVCVIDDHRDAYGVEPICTVLPIAPSTYHRHRSGQLDPRRRSLGRIEKLLGKENQKT